MTVTRFVVSPAVLGGLAGMVPGEKSPLSPLHIPNPPELTPEQRESLFEAGMLDQNGLVGSARLMLAALAEAPSFARIRLNAPTGYLDEAIHFTGDGASSMGISNTPDGLVLISPGDADHVFSQIKEFTGSSSYAGPAWLVDLLPLEMLCLAALIDLRRQAVLHAIVDQQPVVPLPCDVSAIVDAIHSMWGNPQWLTNAIQSATAIHTPPTAPLVQAALSGLVEKKQAWQQSGNYYPIPEAIQTADRFLLIGTTIHLDAGNANMQGRFTLSRQSWLQAGISEMLHISQVKDNIRLQLVSPAVALEKIRFFLTNYDAVTAPPIQDVELSIAIQAGIGAGKTFPLGDETVIGRSEQATVHILDTRASRRHAVIRKLFQGYQLTDAGSTNGTFLNGELLSGPSWLQVGDMIAIGETQIKVFRSGDHLSQLTSDQTVFTGGGVQSSTPVQPNPTTPQLETAQSDEPAMIEHADPPEPAFSDPQASDESLPAVEDDPAPPMEPLPAVMAEPDQPELDHPAALVEPEPSDESLQASAADSDVPQEVVPASFVEPEVLAETGLPEQTADPKETLDLTLDSVCPQCGSAVNPGARFCGACGNQLEP